MKVELHLSLAQLNLIEKLVKQQLQEDKECYDILKRRRIDLEEDDELCYSDELKFIRDDMSLLSDTIYMEEDILNILVVWKFVGYEI